MSTPVRFGGGWVRYHSNNSVGSAKVLQKQNPMKSSKSTSPLFRSQAFPCAITLSLLAAGSAVAADGTWTGGTAVTWATATNWSGSIVPGGSAANSDKVTFNSGTYTFAPTTVNNYFIGGLEFGASNGAISVTTGTGNNRLNVGSGGVLVVAGSGAVTIGLGSTQGANLTSSQNWTNNSDNPLAVTRIAVDDAATTANGTYTLTFNGSGAGGFTNTNGMHDVLTAASAVKKLAVTINTSNGATEIATSSTFSGGTTLTAGTVRYTNVDGTVGAIINSSFGTGSLTLNGGRVTSNANATGTKNILNPVTIGGDVTLGATTTYTGGLNFNAAVGLGAVNRTLTTDSNATFSGVVSGSGGITKAGAATLTLAGLNDYTGATDVDAGTLVVNGNISTSTLTTVDSGATLAGSGTLGKTIVNGTLAVGNNPGQMNFADTLTLAGSTVMEIDGTLGAGVTAGHDFVNLTGSDVAGGLTYGGTLTLDIGFIFATGNYSWNLFDFASEAGGFTSIALADQYIGSLTDSGGVWDLTSGTDTWQFTESTGALSLTVVPEPSAALLGGLGMLALLRRRRA